MKSLSSLAAIGLLATSLQTQAIPLESASSQLENKKPTSEEMCHFHGRKIAEALIQNYREKIPKVPGLMSVSAEFQLFSAWVVSVQEVFISNNWDIEIQPEKWGSIPRIVASIIKGISVNASSQSATYTVKCR